MPWQTSGRQGGGKGKERGEEGGGETKIGRVNEERKKWKKTRTEKSVENGKEGPGEMSE